MPLTVITLVNTPPSLKGDLTKWMQEIATGVYIGNFNTKVREELRDKIVENLKNGEATMSFPARNEIGYDFKTINSNRDVVDFDGIPLIMIPIKIDNDSDLGLKRGFSAQSKLHQARKYTSTGKKYINYVVIDIETDGLNYEDNNIIEIGALKIKNGNLDYFERLIKIDLKLPIEIVELTGINDEILINEGQDLESVLEEFINFIEDLPLINYGNDFDIIFINKALEKFSKPKLKNKNHDLMRYAKKEKRMLKNYKLQTVLDSYGINEKLPHRALEDAKLIYQLTNKVNNFKEIIK